MFALKSKRFATARIAVLLVVMLALPTRAPTALAAGIAWSAVSSGVSVNLRAVQFPTTSTGFIVGDSGTILKTTDGGGTWIPQVSGTTLDLYGLAMLDTQTGWAVGDLGVGIKTTNGGSTWTAMSLGTSNRLLSVAVDGGNVVSQDLLAVGHNGTTLRSIDGGATWTPVSSGTIQHLTSVARFNAAWAVGTTGTILRNSIDDQGQFAWSDRSSAFRTTNTLLSVDYGHPGNSDEVWAVGVGGVIFHSSDQGNSWIPQTSGTTANLWSVTAPDRFNLWVVGDGVILKTIDGGTTWTAQSSPFQGSLLSVRFPDSQSGFQFAESREGWAVGALGTLLRGGQAKTFFPVLTKNHEAGW